MTDFSQLSEEQILAFVDVHFNLFASERNDAFPANVLDELARGTFAIIRRKEGFAIAYKGRHYKFGTGFVEADLMFVYVAPEIEGKGIGTQLIEQVKAAVTPGVPIILKCEGAMRRQFFERRGFTIVEHYQDVDHYVMRWTPVARTALNATQ